MSDELGRAISTQQIYVYGFKHQIIGITPVTDLIDLVNLELFEPVSRRLNKKSGLCFLHSEQKSSRRWFTWDHVLPRLELSVFAPFMDQSNRRYGYLDCKFGRN